MDRQMSLAGAGEGLKTRQTNVWLAPGGEELETETLNY